ncbi:Glycogen synthase [Rosistilla carotiformis]|uniref:Glycogen synthase n=1 Tax=Rosistilla carotiformis TaxID=2528017 RepID=A0A518K0V3_9BACT|nr:glycosyltransferase [Rosistilla carotiformis]QDV71420.1 Glycogen synthase [Rosistilla carotiformis]
MKPNATPMRLLITTSTFPIHPNDGIPRFVLDLAQALSAHGDVRVLAPDAPGAATDEQIGDVHVHRFRYFWPRSRQRLAITNQRGMRDNLRGSLLAKLQVPCFLIRQAIVVRREVRRHRIDVVNAHWLVPQGLTTAWALKRMRQVKFVLHVHAGDVYMLQRLRIGRAIARYVVKRCDAVFADGSHVRDALHDLIGNDCGTVLQPMGVDGARFATNTNAGAEDTIDKKLPAQYILFVGRLVEKKGTIYLIRALKRLQETHPGIALVIAGFGPDEAALRQLTEELELTELVTFLGRQSHDQIVDLLHGCRVAAVPSIIDSRGETEGMPTVVVESLAAGVPVVGSRVNGIPDVIRHTENGWLCNEKDPADLAEKLQLALACDRPKMRIAAEATAQNYDWQQVAGNYMQRIQQADIRPMPEAI